MSNKRIIPFIFAMPALLLLFVFKLVPAFYSFIISWKKYQPFKGLMGSPWAGTENYSRFLQSNEFSTIFTNTIKLNALSVLMTSVVAVILIIFISRMPSRWWKLVSVIILAIPAFIPISSYVWVFIKAISPGTFFSQPSYYPYLFAAMDSLRNIYVPVIIGSVVCDRDINIDFKKVLLVITGYILTRLTLLLSPDVEILLASYNPSVYSTADVLDTYVYRVNVLQSQYSTGSAVWVIKTMIQLLVNIIIYIVLSGSMKRFSFNMDNISRRVSKGIAAYASVIGFILFSAGSIGVVLLAFVPSSDQFIHSIKLLISNKELISSFCNTFIYSLASSIVYGLVTLLLAYPLTVRSRIYPFILLIIMSLSNNIIGEFLFIRSLGMVNTIYPVIIASGLSVFGAYALHLTVKDKFYDGIPDFGKYVKTSILPLVAIMTLFFIANWGGYFYQYAFVTKRSLFGLGMLGVQFLTKLDSSLVAYPDRTAAMLDALRAAFLLLASVIPITLGTVLICLNKYFPLSSFSANVRK